MEVTCDNCAATLNRSPSHVKARVFCNIECRKAFHRENVACAGCGNMFVVTPQKPLNRHCSWECFKASRWEPVQCAECGETFQKRVSEIRKASENGHRHMCSRSCRNANTSKLLGGTGEWEVGGKHGKARSRGKDWRHAKAFALQRDNYTCQQCETKENLEVHHWEPYFVSFNNHPDNLVTLCRSCHQDKHEEYRREGFYEDLRR